MVSPAADITTLPSLLPWGGGAVAAFLIALGVIWRGGLKEYLEKRREFIERLRDKDVAVATHNANTARSQERGMEVMERVTDKQENALVRHEELIRRQEAILESRET